MRNQRRLSCTLAALVLLSVEASADPILLSISSLDAPNSWYNPAPVPFADAVTGGVGTLYGDSLGHFPWTEYHQPISAAFSFDLDWHRPGTPDSAYEQVLLVRGRVTGSYDQKADSSRVGGGYQGTASSVQLLSTGPLPEAMLDLVNHPERIHIQAWVTDGTANDLEYTITLDPLSVPEPSTLALLTLSAGALVLRPRRRRD